MEPRPVAVVGEHLELGDSIADLLRASGVPACRITALEALETLGVDAGIGTAPLLVVAVSGGRSETVERWSRGEFPGSPLLVVGSRETPSLGPPDMQRVDLPLQPAELVRCVRERMGR